MGSVWVRWVLPFGVAVALMAGLIAFVDAHNNDNLAVQSPAQAARVEREGAIVTAQDQVPHVLHVAVHGSAKAAMVRAVHTEMMRLIDNGTASGPLQRTTCQAAGHHGGVVGFHCTAVAVGTGYRFEGVVDAAHDQLIFCKHDEPPVPGEDIPVSRRCQA